MVTVLSIDGGGMRGIIPAVFLEELERRAGVPTASMFRLVAGTSTGGLLAAMLTVPGRGGTPRYTAAEAVRAYERLGRRVFHRSFLRCVRTLGGLIGPMYPSRPLERALRDTIGAAPLRSTLTNIMIPAYDMKRCVPLFFKTQNARLRPGSPDDPPLALAAQAGASAPVFFPPTPYLGRCLVDGGLFAANPAMCALAQARRSWPEESEVLLVSLGTGERLLPRGCAELRRWGAACWCVPLFEVIQSASGETVDYQTRALLGAGRCIRFQFTLPANGAELDDASPQTLARLKALAHEEMRRRSAEVDSLCRILAGEAARSGRFTY